MLNNMWNFFNNNSGAVTAFTAIVALVISLIGLLTTWYNIHSSTKPMLKAYLVRINPGRERYFLVIKNFGASTAIIDTIETSMAWSKILNDDKAAPFEFIKNAEFPPGYLVYTDLSSSPLIGSTYNVYASKKPNTVMLTIKYRYGLALKQHSSISTINLSYTIGLEDTYSSITHASENYQLNKIADILTDLVKRNL